MQSNLAILTGPGFAICCKCQIRYSEDVFPPNAAYRADPRFDHVGKEAREHAFQDGRSKVYLELTVEQYQNLKG